MSSLSRIEKNGFAHLKNLAITQEVNKIDKSIQLYVKSYATDIHCTEEDYLRNVNHWDESTVMVKSLQHWIALEMNNRLNQAMGEELKLSGCSISQWMKIPKDFVQKPQQTVASIQNPSEFSVWLPMHSIGLELWSPTAESCNDENSVLVKTSAGNAIVVDPQAWYRPISNEVNEPCFVLITHWRRADFAPPKRVSSIGPCCSLDLRCFLPEKIADLREGLMRSNRSSDREDLESFIESWLQITIKGEKFPFLVNQSEATEALYGALILSRASSAEKCGDAVGLVYHKMEKYLLKPLSKWLLEGRTQKDE